MVQSHNGGECRQQHLCGVSFPHKPKHKTNKHNTGMLPLLALGLLHLLLPFQSADKTKAMYFWIDCFSINQHVVSKGQPLLCLAHVQFV